jgi:carbon storage regulator
MAMLVMPRKKGEEIVINGDIVVRVVEILGDKVKLGIQAPREATVHRREVWQMVEAKRQATPAKAATLKEAGVSGIPDDAVCFFRDGNQWLCVNGDFVNLQVSPAGYGDTFAEALEDLGRRKADQ